MEFFQKETVKKLILPGCVSTQLVSPFNSTASRVTLTDVKLEPGAVQPRHTHEESQQIWYALEGTCTLLLSGEEEREFTEGEVVVFYEQEVHGAINRGEKTFRYISITNPPQNFSNNYDEVR